MATFSELCSGWEQRFGKEREQWFDAQMTEALSRVSARLNDANVILYFSSFQQRRTSVGLRMEPDDKDNLEFLIENMDIKKELAIIMHTPGDNWNSGQLISDYIHSKFAKITVIVPTMPLSTVANLCLSGDKIIISRDRYESMRGRGVDVQGLEDDQELRNAVLTAYHLVAMSVKESSVMKWIISDNDLIGKMYIK